MAQRNEELAERFRIRKLSAVLRWIRRYCWEAAEQCVLLQHSYCRVSSVVAEPWCPARHSSARTQQQQSSDGSRQTTWEWDVVVAVVVDIETDSFPFLSCCTS